MIPVKLGAKHRKTLARVLAHPTAANLKWRDAEGLLLALGFRKLEGSGSRTSFHYPEKQLIVRLHRPHPSPDLAKGAVEAIRDALQPII